ncbi:MAG TPA: hypothetical protein VGF84_17710 [Micromonosporaceae bacterium]|jgi:chromosome segregation ATPase
MSHDVVDTRSAYAEGQADALRAQLAALEAADEHHRAELAAAVAEAAEAHAAVREIQKRMADRDHTIAELRRRLERAHAAQDRAEQERAAVIAALGRRARRRLVRPAE